MSSKKFSLKIVNDGEPFSMPKWTVKKHRLALAELHKNCKDMSDEEQGEEFNYFVIYQTLKEIDSNITIDDIKNLHPETIITLFNEVYSAGKEEIYFREGRKPNQKKKKSTGMKS